MSDDLIDKFLAEGKLKHQKVGLIQVESLLHEALRDLKECQDTIKIADRAPYIMAYNAILKAARALLLFKGYRPDDGEQHKTVVVMTGVFLGKAYSDAISLFEKMRRKRNELTYDSNILLSHTESERVFSTAIGLVKDILNIIKKQNPQMELKFELEK